MTDAFAPLVALLSQKDFDDILIVSHASPDGDAIGSGYALATALRFLGKRANPHYRERDDATFDYITRDFPMQDFSVRHVITVDVASLHLLGGFVPPVAVDAVIDHHRNNDVKAPVKLCLPTYASCGEIVFELVERLGGCKDEFYARCLYTALSTDTGRFCYPNTTERSFRIAAKLCTMVKAGHFADINKRVFETASKEKMALEAYAVSHARYFHKDRFSVLAMDEADKAQFSAKEGDYDGLINVLRRVEGVCVSAFIRPRDGGYKVSLRAEPGFDCSALCARFGGGGHVGAAGCFLTGEKEQVVNQIVKAVGEALA